MTPDLSNLLLAPILTFLLVLGGVTSFKLLSGRIVTRGLIADSASGQVRALRVQMLLSTLTAAGAYGSALSRAEASAFPTLDYRLLLLVGGSNGVVIAAQALRQLLAVLTPGSASRKGKS